MQVTLIKQGLPGAVQGTIPYKYQLCYVQEQPFGEQLPAIHVQKVQVKPHPTQSSPQPFSTQFHYSHCDWFRGGQGPKHVTRRLAAPLFKPWIQ